MSRSKTEHTPEHMPPHENIETGKGLKKRTSRDGKKALIQTLKEKDGRETTDREQILGRCAEFYQALYEDP